MTALYPLLFFFPYMIMIIIYNVIKRMNLSMKIMNSISQNKQKPGVGEDKLMLTSQENIYTSGDLLGEANSVLIDHRGVIYTLRLTQFGKLILTK
jgi:hemin uptake protein HemP